MRAYKFIGERNVIYPRTTLIFLLSAGLLLSIPLTRPAAEALADSDGYYCAGRGYLAYQFSGLSTPIEGHTLYLFELAPDKGISKPRQFALDPFQVLGMRCLDHTVDLLAWDRIYRIGLNDPESPSIGKVEPQPEDSVFPDFTSDNLGRWAPATQTIPLKTAGGRFSFELVIEQQTDPETKAGPGVIRHRIRSFVRQKDAGGTIIEREIFSGSREETVD
ncbi:MAG: hypothetical protein A2X84_04215 [Desulfuromonadaceae bacterium GWC2_58_13]|nr:MAG: hypothetical protein A2X84_04215 [Desulfuromonadaceae bacterium GWC2_58_13]